MKKFTERANRLQDLFGSISQKTADDFGLFLRNRKISAMDFVTVNVFAWLENKNATNETFINMYEKFGISITEQAISKRFNENSVLFFHSLVSHSLKTLVNQNKEAIPLLDRFTGGVYIDDCSTVKMPLDLAELLPGCGGGKDPKDTAAAIKTFCRFEITSGNYAQLLFGAGKTSDHTLENEADILPRNSLHLADMGFFCIKRFEDETKIGAYFISRIPAGKTIGLGKDKMSITSYLKGITANIVDEEMHICGSQTKFRFIAIRVPEKVSQQRINRAKKDNGKKGGAISCEQVGMSKWTVFITNIPKEKCSVDEISALYRVRWQIELVFKLWKSECGLSESHGRSGYRRLCEFFAKLLGIIVVNWLSLSRCGMLGGVSATRLWRCVKRNIEPIVMAIMEQDVKKLSASLKNLAEKLEKIPRQKRRKRRPSTRETLQNTGPNP
ncbi:MAG: IS4 family transposase [Thermoguttaceae bacterium]